MINSKEKLKWKDIKLTDKGLNYEIPKALKGNLPDSVPKDCTPVSLRVSKKFRIVGWRSQEYLFIIWFDKNHKSYTG